MFLSNSFVCFFIFNHINQLIKQLFPCLDQPSRQIILSTSHAIFTSIISTLYLHNLINDLIFYHLISISFGFTLYDIKQILVIRNRVWKQMLLHHCMIIGALCPFVYYSFTNILPFALYPYYIAMNYLVEFATIPLNISWYLHENNKQETIVFKIISITTILLYLPFRVFNTAYLSFYSLMYLPHVMPLQEIQITFFIMNLYWFYRLCKKAQSLHNKKQN